MASSNTDNVCRVPVHAWTIFLVFLRLGLTSFGGPVAHLGYFRDEFVARRRWLSDRAYADLVALSQCLPGPSSSQVGMAIGLIRGHYAGAFAAWAGFTLPSALLMAGFAMGLAQWHRVFPGGVLHGLKVVAVAVVAQAVWGMARNFCTDAIRIVMALISAGFVLLWPASWAQVGVIVIGAMVGLLLFRTQPPVGGERLPIAVSRRTGVLLIVLFFVLLGGLPLLQQVWPGRTLALTENFYRVASLVFGGGHVVLPLLQAEVVPRGWIGNETFLAGYGAAQAIPGPLFSFAAFVGAAIDGWTGAAVCLLAIFAPSFLLVAGTLPFWEQLRRNARMQAALSGINAAVVGLLLAALYQPVWTGAVSRPLDVVWVLLALAALMLWRLPPWLVVLASGAAGWGIGLL